MSVTLDDIKNPYTLNIFTDASIKKLGDKKYIGCYGAVAINMDTTIDQSYKITGNTTNNNSEIKAVREGIILAIKYGKYYKTINLFSDSQICILGLRDRLLTWECVDNNFYGSSGQIIANQSIFMEICYLILQYRLSINLLHQAGHVLYTMKSLQDAIHVFKVSNNIRGIVDMNFIRYISMYNTHVDNMSRNILRSVRQCNTIDPVSFSPSGDFDKELYQKLTQNTLKEDLS